MTPAGRQTTFTETPEGHVRRTAPDGSFVEWRDEPTGRATVRSDGVVERETWEAGRLVATDGPGRGGVGARRGRPAAGGAHG
ncbi:MAG: hypothetical protein R3F43_00195 [bacterium]